MKRLHIETLCALLICFKVCYIRHIFSEAVCTCACVCVCDYHHFQLLLRMEYTLFLVLFIHFGMFLREEREKHAISAACLNILD